MRSVPIPGEILRTDVFLGLTFDELVTLGAAPLVVVVPTLFIQQIPLIVSIGVIALSAVGVAAIVLKTPEGQTPLEWAPAAFKRRFKPDTYYVKPRFRNRDEIVYANATYADPSAADITGDVSPEAPSAVPDEGTAEIGASVDLDDLADPDSRGRNAEAGADSTGETDAETEPEAEASEPAPVSAGDD